jgi:rhomboid protease GluP
VAAFEAGLGSGNARPVATATLVALNVAAFLGMAWAGVSLMAPAAGALFRWGGNFPPVTVQGQWWRLLTATFLHAGAVHLVFNMVVLWDAGKRMERILGRGGFLVCYLLSGLAGSVASLAFHPASVSVGASGAIFGLFGALLGFLARSRRRLPRPVMVATPRPTNDQNGDQRVIR